MSTSNGRLVSFFSTEPESRICPDNASYGRPTHPCRPAARWACASVLVLGAFAASGVRAATADGINTNNALTPARGQTILRSQLRMTRFAAENADVQITRYVAPFLVAYGLHERVALIAVVPAVARVGFMPDATGRRKLSDYGAGDGRLLTKTRIFTRDGRGKTARVAVLAGVEIPSYDSPFSSDSFDPLGGVSISFKNLERNLDIDAVYKVNTADGADDCVVYNVAYTQTLLQGQSLDDSLWQLNAVVEINAESTTGGRNVAFLAPGVQLALAELIVEASVQAPVVRDTGPNLQPTSAFVVGMRRLW